MSEASVPAVPALEAPASVPVSGAVALAVPPAPNTIVRSHAAQQAGIIASMARAHEKMLREIYYQKLQRGQIRQMTQENKDLKKKVTELEQGTTMKKSFSAQQAGIIASMARAHEKMLREIYYQKLQRGRNKNVESENSELKKRIAELESGQNLKKSFGAQQAGVIASMAKAHEKMLREVYYQKLQRRKMNENEDYKKKASALEAKVAELEEANKATAALLEATNEHNAVAQALVLENEKLKKLLESQEPFQSQSPSHVQSDKGGTEVDSLLRANKRLELENMRLERRVHELEGIPMLEQAVRQGSPTDMRVMELEQRVNELEALSPRLSPRHETMSHAHSPMASRSPMVAQSPLEPVGHSPMAKPGASHVPSTSAPFTVRVACDVHGVKHNVRLSFIGVPTMSNLINAVDNYFDTVARVNHPPGCPDVPFSLAALQIFDTTLQKWVNLTDPFMISDDAQLFCFQQASVWHPDRPGTIPVPDTVETWIALPNSPQRVALREVPNKTVMIIQVFKDMDCLNGGVLQYNDFREALSRYGMELLTSTSGELFTKIDKKKDGVITTDEWVDYCRENPRFVEALYCKSNDTRGHRAAAYSHSPPHDLTPTQYERFTSLRDSQADRRYPSLPHSPRY
eukprot:TRINITY_DN1406_c0_g1_i1.p1 TRINITY_DN1406_c0_g1~~TRINITY_DN1406_c0_g1_i1.p1  ORF type:complete len:631 (+),score=180.60 TRINITY_DN1406_c0_g1_i1:49-1941(+)